MTQTIETTETVQTTETIQTPNEMTKEDILALAGKIVSASHAAGRKRDSRMGSTGYAERHYELKMDVYVKMLESLPKWKDTGASKEKWLYVVGYNHLRNLLTLPERTTAEIEELTDDIPSTVNRDFQANEGDKAVRNPTEDQKEYLLYWVYNIIRRIKLANDYGNPDIKDAILSFTQSAYKTARKLTVESKPEPKSESQPIDQPLVENC